jgi:hypothetical protein
MEKVMNRSKERWNDATEALAVSATNAKKQA